MADRLIKKYSTSSNLLLQTMSAGEKSSGFLDDSELAVRHELVAEIQPWRLCGN
jgi:hypothetical protein